MKEKVVIIIPVRGCPANLKKCFSSLWELDYPDYEVIVVDDGLSREGLSVLDEFKDKIKVLQSGGYGPSFSRNLAARNTSARFLAFTDSDCIVEKNWLKELMKGFERYPDAVACGGRQRLPADAEKFERKVFLFMKRTGFITDYMRRVKEDDLIEVNHNPSCNVIYKRDIFLQEGGFLEGLWPGEDVELDYRLKKKGYKVIFNPAAIVYHYKQKNLKSFSEMMYRYGKAQGFLVKKHGVFRKIQMVPFGLAAGILCVIFSGFLSISILKYVLIASIIAAWFLRIAVAGIVYWNIGFGKGFLNFARTCHL